MKCPRSQAASACLRKIQAHSVEAQPRVGSAPKAALDLQFRLWVAGGAVQRELSPHVIPGLGLATDNFIHYNYTLATGFLDI